MKVINSSHKMSIVVVTMFLWALCSQQVSAQAKKSKAAYENIMTRASVRSFQDRTVEDDLIEQLLRAGMAAPTAVDKRPWHFVVVTDKEKLRGITEACPNARAVEDAPLAIVVCGDTTKMLKRGGVIVDNFWIMDCSAATENILLAANSLGLGAVWCNAAKHKDSDKSVSQVLGLPDYI